MHFRTNLRLFSLIAAVAAWTLAAVLLMRDTERPVPFAKMVGQAVTTERLERAEQVRIFFGHASVGQNLLNAVPEIYTDRGLPAPSITQLQDTTGSVQPIAQAAPSEVPGSIEHAYIGENGDPLGKIEDFDARMRAGMGDQVDVAFMKFCYADIISGTDVDAVFAAYRSTMAALERDYPDVTFLYVTTPLSTEPGLKAKVKKLLGRDDHMGPADNAARERFNSLMRAEYPADRLFDLAALESTDPDGKRSSGSTGGEQYYSLYDGYAADPGHLNEAGAAVAAAHLLDLIADVARERA